MSASRNYILHIDGIRAISVLAVIFFHFHLLGFTGGYIGVDVFFTISGYLIIGSIVGQAEAGKFKPSSFWGRRIRRLFPAIFAVLFLSFIAGLLLMSPSDLTKLSKDSLFALVSLINFTLLGSTDYFDLQGFNEPLLHFWSLAVEEQFYLIFPLIALSIFALFGHKTHYKKAITWVLIILSILSLIGAEYALRFGNPLFAYYMMPTRFFQLALGGVLAIALQSEDFHQKREALPKIAHDLFVLAAIAIIMVLSLIFTKSTPFPGINAIWPTLAALALLYSGGHSHLSFSLENPISAHIGKLSYSLYLVHWPVWSFMCYYFDRALTLPETLIALALTYFISLFIYKCIESPVRFSPGFKGRRLYAIVTPAAVAAAGIFFVTIAQNGWLQRLPQQQRAFARDAGEFHRTNYGGQGYPIIDFSHLGHPLAAPDFFLFGDSKAGQLLSGLDKALLERNRSAIFIVENGCLFLPGAGKVTDGKRIESCQATGQKAIDFAMETNLPIVMARAWRTGQNVGQYQYAYLDNNINEKLDGSEIIARHIDVINQIHNAKGGRKITIIADNVMFGDKIASISPVASCISRPSFLGLPCKKASSVKVEEVRIPEIEQQFKKIAEQNRDIEYLPAIPLYCQNSYCDQISETNDILYSDSYHLSKLGSSIVAQRLISALGLDAALPSPGVVRSIEDIEASIMASLTNHDDALLEKDLEDFLLFSQTKKSRYNLVNALWNGSDTIERNREGALKVATYFSDKEDEKLSTYITGFAYWWGEGGVEKDFDKALAYWTKPSQLSNATVQYRIAEIYLNEDLPQFDQAKGIERLRMAAEGGNEDAIARLADIGN